MKFQLHACAMAAGLVLASPGSASATNEQDAETAFQHATAVNAIITEMAFEPSVYFQGERGSDIVRIVYTGDDYDLPVYSIAIRTHCTEGGTPDCRSKLRARIVRAPAVDSDRPRARGRALISALADAKTKSPERLAQLLDEQNLDWMEADLSTCAGAMTIMAEATQVTWVLREDVVPVEKDTIGIVLHADMVKVEFWQYARLATYYGYIADGSPGAWAVKLAEILEPCWKPVTAAVPWHRAGD